MPVLANLPIVIIATFLFVICIAIYTLFNYSIDKTKHPEEWQNAGSSGERIVYNTLINNFKIPEEQILRNVYIPTENGRTAEIDLLVISKKGIFVFECKNYGGNIYGDTKLKKWVQYIGKEKNYFYNPLLQNKGHVRYLQKFLIKEEIDVPIVPFITTIARGNWKIRNLEKNDYVLGYNCHFKDIYKNMPDSEAMAKNFTMIMKKLTPLSRPDASVRKKHAQYINKNRH